MHLRHDRPVRDLCTCWVVEYGPLRHSVTGLAFRYLSSIVTDTVGMAHYAGQTRCNYLIGIR